jgi:large subunit ribosomal protein L29
MKTKKLMNELRGLTVDELKHKENDLRKELLNLRMERSSHQLKNLLKLRWTRRNLARVLTLKKEKEAK